MNEELDYMSDEFIKNCVGDVNNVRPGLLKSHKEERQHKLLKKKSLELENKKKPISVLQVEVLEESLKQPINATNKGFSMLEKMGFKSGVGLGKNCSGIKEPIGINIKNNKMGFGYKLAHQIKQREKNENKLSKANEHEFRAFLSKKNKERSTLSDFRKSQRICKELDLKSDKIKPQESWFWPCEEHSEPDLVSEKTGKILDQSGGSDYKNNEGDDDDTVDNIDEEIELSNAEKLEALTKYLRENYFYCVWCKVQYTDEKDILDCPGPTRDDH